MNCGKGMLSLQMTKMTHMPTSPHQRPHQVKQMHRTLIVQMQEIKGLCHVTGCSDIDSTYIPYLIVYPMLCVRVCTPAAVHTLCTNTYICS